MSTFDACPSPQRSAGRSGTPGRAAEHAPSGTDPMTASRPCARRRPQPDGTALLHPYLGRLAAWATAGGRGDGTAGLPDDGAVGELAERLHHRPSERDLHRPAITVRAFGATSSAAQRRALTREVLDAVTLRIGPPTLYGGAADGPVVRWRTTGRTLLLDRGEEGLRLSVRRTAELEAEERARFTPGSRSDPASYYRQVPYLWQLHRHSAGSPPLDLPSVPAARDWSWLEASLTALLGAWWEQLPAQIGPHDVAGFNLVAPGGRARCGDGLSVLCSEADGVQLLVDDRTVPGGTPGAVMVGRGWGQQVMGWWQRDFHDLGAAGAAAAARMAVGELRLRGVRSPGEVAVTEVRCEDGGLLALPGLALRR